jgi:iron complex outermembrane receptor protein
MYFKALKISVLILFPLFSFSQEKEIDSVYVLENIDVFEQRNKNLVVGYKSEEVNSEVLKSYASSSVSELLNSVSGVSIKSYGPSGISSISIRGGGANNTAINWNGVNIQSPTLGSFNLSLLPVDIFDNVSLQYGASGALNGSGANFGQLNLSSGLKNIDSTVFGLNLSSGSYGAYRLSAHGEFKGESNAVKIKIFRSISDNDFVFKNSYKYGSPYETQDNAAFESYGFSLSSNSFVSDNLEFSTSIFYQDSHVETQSRMSDYSKFDGFQDDENIFVNTSLKYSDSFYSLNLKNSLIRSNSLIYNPNSIVEESLIETDVYSSELESNFRLFNSTQLYTSFLYAQDIAKSDGFADRAIRERLGIVVALKNSFLKDRLKTVFSLREEAQNYKYTPIQYSIGADYQMLYWLKSYVNYSSIYRFPSLNDLFWQDTGDAVGNPNLIPENGFNFDIGISQTIISEGFTVSFDQNVFYNRLKDKIIWTPSVNNRWTPENFDDAISKGIELGLKANLKFDKMNFNYSTKYFYTDSKVFNSNIDSWIGQFYVPLHSINNSFGLSFSNYSFVYLHNYEGRKAVDASGNFLEAYNLGNVILDYKLPFEALTININLRINNIWGEDYQLSSDYAMPLQNFTLNTKLLF